MSALATEPAGADATADPRHAALLAHARQPRNRRELAAPTHRGRGSNALCGDVVAVALRVEDGMLREAAFKGRGCTACIASASLMTELVAGRPLDEALALAAGFRRWIAGGDAAWPLPSALTPLAPVRERPARRRCLSLAWEALDDALA